MTTPDYSPGLEGVIATETSVSYLDVDIEQILVRGYDLIELAQNLCYTDVAYLVIYGELPTPAQAKAFCDRLVAEAEVPGRALPPVRAYAQVNRCDGRPPNRPVLPRRIRGPRPAARQLPRGEPGEGHQAARRRPQP